MANSTLPAKLKALLTKRFGEDIHGQTYEPTDYISTGVPTIDAALGVQGIPCGRLTTFVGQPSSGKSALLYSCFAEVLRREGVAVLLETEDTYSSGRFSSIGGDPDKLIVLQPGSVEKATRLIGEMIEWHQESDPTTLFMIGWDSIAATPLDKEVDNDEAVATMGGHSKLISQMLRKYTHTIAKSRTSLVFVNQWREKMNMSGPPSAWADSKVMIADKPIRFHSSLILDIQNSGKLKADKTSDPHGIEVRVTVAKNKLAAPYRVARADYLFDTGFDLAHAWLDIAEVATVVKKQGGGYYLFPDGEKLRRADAEKKMMADQALRDTAMSVVLSSSAAVTNTEEGDEWQQVSA